MKRAHWDAMTESWKDKMDARLRAGLIMERPSPLYGALNRDLLPKPRCGKTQRAIVNSETET
jgi:hypothetical protein